MRGLLLLLVLAVLAATGLFAHQNQVPITLHFAGWQWEHVQIWYPVVAAAAAVLAACVLYGIASGARWRIRHMRLNRATRDSYVQMRQLEKENLKLRRQLYGDTDQVPYEASGSWYG